MERLINFLLITGLENHQAKIESWESRSLYYSPMKGYAFMYGEATLLSVTGFHSVLHLMLFTEECHTLVELKL